MRNKRKKRWFTWYMEPLNPQTNHAMAAILPEEDAVQNAICQGKTQHNVWRCKHADVRRFIAAASEFNFKFAVFKREGRYGLIRKWNFEKVCRQKAAGAKT